MNTLILLMAIIGLLGALLGAPLGAVIPLWRGAKGWRNRGKALLITLPETPQTLASLEWVSARDGYLDLPGDSKEPGAEKGDKDRVLLNGPASYPSTWGPLHLHTTYGANLVAPSKQEAARTIEYVAVANWIATHGRKPVKDEADFREGLAKAQAEAKKLATRFEIWDPRTYYKACRESVMQKLYNSTGAGGDPWYAKALIVIGIISIVGVLAVLAITVVKVIPALNGA